jgi:hypothetical protein
MVRKYTICLHNKRKEICKECGGSQICEHNKIKSQCRDCNGGSFCIHDKRKTTCRECKGGSICEHNRRKLECKECCGSQICEHNKRKDLCKECNGSQICIHNKITYYCKECDGNAFCEHNKEKNRCKDCGGSSRCEHNRLKSQCKECDGISICHHDKQKGQCIICSPKIACYNCKHMVMSSNKSYRPYCFKCYCVRNPDIEIKRRYKTKENLLGEALKEMNLGINFIQDKKVDGGCSYRRPDFLFDLFTHTVIVECDENDHKDYSTTCEIAKLNETFTDLADRPMILIKFNPDKYEGKTCFDKDCKLIKTEWNSRIKILKNEVKKAVQEIPEDLITIKNLFSMARKPTN